MLQGRCKIERLFKTLQMQLLFLLPESCSLQELDGLMAQWIDDLDIVLSWNFRHIVRRKTKDIVNMVNTMQNQRHIEITTPGELL